MYCVYRIYDKDKLLYVGKSINIYDRLTNHLQTQSWNKEITHIEVAECISEKDMNIYERFYIRGLKPKYNLQVYGKSIIPKIEGLVFKRYNAAKCLEYYKLKCSRGVRSASFTNKDTEILKFITKQSSFSDYVKKLIKQDMGIKEIFNDEQEKAIIKLIENYYNSNLKICK